MKKIHMSAWALGALVVCAPAMKAIAAADVALCVLHQVHRWGTLGDITAYSVGTTSVNVGNTNLQWQQNNINHPVISQNMYRIYDGKIEQIGQSWLKHSFCALQINSGCSSGCPGQNGCLNFLAPGCQDPYSAQRNGSQSLLGPKWQVNANTGFFSYPAANGTQGGSGDLAYMRLQVHNSDLGDSDSTYLVSGQYVSNQDATAGNQNNNESYRLVNIGSAPTYAISFIGGHTTQFRVQAIYAWKDHGNGAGSPDNDVTVKNVQIPNEGLVIVANKVSDNGDGTWHYEYAVQNMNSDVSVGSFSVPVGSGATVSNMAFHDVDYHSGDGPGIVNYDGTDWPATVGAGDITWTTFQTHAQNPNGNALRWATLYNYSFDADSPPVDATATLGLFKPHSPQSVTASIQGPSELAQICPWDCEDDDGNVGIVDFLALLAQWDMVGTPCDFDGGGVGIVDFLELLANWGACP